MSTRTAGSLRTYLLTRVLLFVPQVIVILTIVFVLMRVAPGDPVSVALGGQRSEEELAELRAAAGYDRPIIVQYWEYISGVLRLDFGHTIIDNRSVAEIFAVNGGATLTLTVAAFVVALLLAVPLGLIAGRFRDTPLDGSLRVFGILTYAAPVFFVGLLMQLAFARGLGWLPSSSQASPVVTARVPSQTNIFLVDALLAGDTAAFWNGVQHLVLPAVTLGLLLTGTFMRIIRVNLIQTMRSDYVEAARARGVSETRVVIQHAFRNAMVPFVTILGLQVALLLGGAILTEQTFNWNGIGSQLVRYLDSRDYIAVQGIITLFALAVVTASLLIDIINAIIDPRVRY
ncbi:ABC transporter permease [Actinobacteria bacterium YIM 96077]|uniref:ABC transporter permease n=1 Tax=Phytoactinopolyspora halophila TaxID=1981511 RepID=A0A329QHX9_9ACTN|nr:ABC transporter permease [Phytoactinopolyspora halophila]AYY14708.1 ABC transporter permease [Actinobacteria bacterium YIM 96077]RAW11581.1 ABC transporter permease [Phytoactinopolyspora halophila]